MSCTPAVWGEALGPGTLSVGLGPSIPRAQGLPAPLLLPRNLILKMVVLGLLCYQWLSRRVVCSTEEVSTAAPGPGRAGLFVNLCEEHVAPM